MPKVRTPDAEEARIIRQNHMDPNNYGVAYRDPDWIRLICFSTRDMVAVNVNPEKEEQKRILLEKEQPMDAFITQILRENEMTPDQYRVTYRSADCIQLLCRTSGQTVTVWRGDRKW